MKKILYFVDGNAPSPEDIQNAASIEGDVLYRNAQIFSEESLLEECDGVAGNVPEPYLKKFPLVKPKFKKAPVEKDRE